VAKLPANVSKAIEAWREASSRSAESADLVMAGDAELVSAAEARFGAAGTRPAAWVRPLGELGAISAVPGQLLLVLVSPEREAEVVSALAEARPKGGAVIAVDEGGAATGKTSSPCLRCTRLSFSDSTWGWERLYNVCAQTSGDRAALLARRYPVLRDAAVKRVIYRTAGQNALIGAAFFVPGADMPAMTANQVRMLLSIASLYGVSVDRERVLELAALVGAGLGLRAFARYLVRSLPGIGVVVKATTGYAATVALGLAAVRYFEAGAPASTSRLMALAGSLRR
jgi:uncharacterized protein (DUF697 family)